MFIKYLLPVICIMGIGCRSNKYLNDIFYDKMTNDIICEILTSNLNPYHDMDTTFIQELELSTIGNPEIFARKHIHPELGFEKLTNISQWNINSVGKICKKPNRNITEKLITSSKPLFISVSKIYFFGKEKGFFIFFNNCGDNCSEANVYTFEITGNKIMFNLASPLFISCL